MRPLILLLAISALCGCRSTETMRYAPADGPFSPVIVSHGSEQRCNRIGVIKDARVDPNSPGIYHQQQKFGTAKGDYRNDIYRVHFERIPLGHLSWGRNVVSLSSSPPTAKSDRYW